MADKLYYFLSSAKKFLIVGISRLELERPLGQRILVVGRSAALQQTTGPT